MNTITASSLTDDLKKVHSLLDASTPEIIKALINRVIRTDPPLPILEQEHDKIKEEIKKLNDPYTRAILRYLVLIPIQLALGKVHPTSVDNSKKVELLSKLKYEQSTKTNEQILRELGMLEGLTTGSPAGQIKHAVSDRLRKVAHFLIDNLHLANTRKPWWLI